MSTSETDIQIGKYLFTVTLKPRLYKLLPKEQLEYSYPLLKKLFKDIKNTTVCELTKQLNIHYHGILDCPAKDLYKLIYALKQDDKKVFGFFDQRPITDMDGVVEYLKKDQDTMWFEFNIDSLLNDDLKLYNKFDKFDDNHNTSE